MKEDKNYKTFILNGEKKEEVVGLDTHSFEYFKVMCDCWSKEDLQYRLWEICKEAIEKDKEIERLNNIIEEYKVNTIPTLEHNIDVLVDSEDRLNNIINTFEEEIEFELTFEDNDGLLEHNTFITIHETLEKVLKRIKELKEGK